MIQKINLLGLLSNIMMTSIIILTFITTQAYSAGNPKEKNSCVKISHSKRELEKWISLALKSNSSIGCPSVTNGSPIAILEEISQQQDKCGKKASGFLMAFYTIFSQHPNYKMCGLSEREELLLSRLAVDGKVCHNLSTDKIKSCFLDVNIIIGNLKKRSETKAAFELAKKTANSGDVTGISQMILAILYQFGNGTELNLPMTIKWQKEALHRLEDRNQRIDCMISLSSAYEDLNEYEKAKIYLWQCASMGDLACKKGFVRLSKL